METHETHDGDLAAVIDAATRAAAPKNLDVLQGAPQHYAVAVPAFGRVEHIVIDDEKHLDHPRRLKGTATLATVDSFIAYVNAHTGDATTLWLDEDRVTITAIFNDHHGDEPGWRDHRAECRLVLTEEWCRWKSADGKLLPQQAFAELIEDGLAEIRDPASATMLEIAQTFQSTLDASFRSGVRLQSGQVQFRYDEQETATAGTNGELEIPEVIKLAIPVFLGEDAYEIDARFRYRARGGDLTLGYKLVHAERVLHDAIELIGVRLAEEFPGQVYIGGAPAAITSSAA